jgi:hypothetical protein
MKPIIKTLPKNLLEEGLTVDLVNSVNMQKKHSPVQLEHGDEPVKLMPCSKGYWILMEDGSCLKDEKNNLMVVDVKKCTIGRARYLLNYGKIEKKQRIDTLVQSWKEECKEELNKLREKMKTLIAQSDPDSNNMFSSLLKQMSPEQFAENVKNAQEKVEKFNPQYESIEKLYSEGNYYELIEIFGIRKFKNPMMSVKMDNVNEMQQLKNVIGKNAIDEWDGDILTMYAAIEIEQKYA